MRQFWLFSLAAAVLLGPHFSVDALPSIKSPLGVVNADVTPLVNQVYSPAIPGCDSYDIRASDVLQDSMLWPWSGLRLLGKEIYGSYKQQAQVNSRSLKYKEATASRGGRATWTEGEIVACVARRMLLNDLPMSSALCACLSSYEGERYCSAMDYVTLRVHCHDNMAAKVNRQQLCPALLTASMGVELSAQCSGHLITGLSPLDLELYTLNFPGSTPDVVEPAIANQEARAYYVAYKAVEKFTRWVDAHLFCSESYPGKVPQDLAVLPGWDPKLYLWIQDPTQNLSRPGLPIGMVAQRGDEQTLLVFRDVRTTFEGRLFLANQQSRRFVVGNVGALHEGYDSVASQLLPILQLYFTQYFADSSTLVRPRVTFVGHGNFGAGIASIIARDLAKSFRMAQGGIPIAYNLIAFDGGSPGDFAFAEELRRLVNVRNIAGDMASYGGLPCEVTKACGGGNQVQTAGDTDTGTRIGPFTILPGRVQFGADQLGGSAWRTDSSKLEVVANHRCAASCWLTTKFCLDDPSPVCSVETCGAFFTEKVLGTV